MIAILLALGGLLLIALLLQPSPLRELLSSLNPSREVPVQSIREVQEVQEVQSSEDLSADVSERFDDSPSEKPNTSLNGRSNDGSIKIPSGNLSERFNNSSSETLANSLSDHFKENLSETLDDDLSRRFNDSSSEIPSGGVSENLNGDLSEDPNADLSATSLIQPDTAVAATVALTQPAELSADSASISLESFIYHGSDLAPLNRILNTTPGNVLIQHGVYPNTRLAQKLIDQFPPTGLVFQISLNKNGRLMPTVLSGPYDDLEQAKAAKALFSEFDGWMRASESVIDELPE